jgi:hypothetical protein
MTIQLVPSREEIAAGDEVTYKIEGLEPRDSGTYVARWTVEPSGRLTTTGNDVLEVGDGLYSVFPAELAGSAETKFYVQAPGPPVTVRVDIRYRRQPFSLSEAPNAHSAVGGKSEAEHHLRAISPGLSGGDTSADSPTAAAISARDADAARLVSMQRAAVEPTASQALWTLIRQSTNALSFQNYQAFMEQVLCGGPAGSGSFPPPPELSLAPGHIGRQLPWRLPFPGVEPYRQLKAATEVFVMLNCGVPFDQFMTGNPPFLSPTQQWSDARLDFDDEIGDERRRYNRRVTPGQLRRAWEQLLRQGEAAEANLPHRVQTILYLALVRANLPDVHVSHRGLDLSPQAVQELDQGAVTCMSILQEKLVNPCFVELIWSYWQEEAGLVQTMNAITWRFQNRRGADERDPLASLEIDPLRPLNNFLWGYIQDEEHRLSVVRRAYEYAHHYGLTLLGKAVPEIRGADNRSHFIESLHNLLHLCSIFYKEDDDTTVVADGFPLLNALKEVHLLLTQGAANQYGDLPWTARLEMLMQQWLLARPEFREFLPRRIMVDYPEEWMSSVETMKTMQGWYSASVLHFRDLAVFGEQIVLSIRFQAWPSVIEAQDAANWARYWRPEIQGYIYAYRAVTGVDVTERPDATAPSLLLRQRMQQSLPTARTALARPKPVAQLPMPSRLEERSGR